MRARPISLLKCSPVLLLAVGHFALPAAAGVSGSASSGEIAFYARTALFRVAGELVEAEFHISVSNDQITFRQTGSTHEADLRLTIAVLDHDGTTVLSRESKLCPVASERLDTTDRGILQTIIDRALLEPGEYSLRIRMEDYASSKPGLLYMIRGGGHRTGQFESRFSVPDPGKESLALSSLVLGTVRRLDTVDSGAWRHGTNLEPSPSGRFGLFAPRLSLFAEVYSPEPSSESPGFIVRIRILDAAGQELLARTRRVRPSSGAWIVMEELDLLAITPAGLYEAELTLRDPDSGRIASARSPFEVMWRAESWTREEEEVLRELTLILYPGELRQYEGLSPAGREYFLNEFWRGLDPSPGTPENEIRMQFRSRIDFADRNFSSTLERGILTDRGRVFVRYGEPDDRITEYSSSGFREDGLREQVTNPGERIALQSLPSAEFRGRGDPSDELSRSLSSQRGGTTIKSKELIVWIYDGPGQELRDRRTVDQRAHRGLKFIFADEFGSGDFHLVSSEGGPGH